MMPRIVLMLPKDASSFEDKSDQPNVQEAQAEVQEEQEKHHHVLDVPAEV
jgi:hypothetical protein